MRCASLRGFVVRAAAIGVCAAWGLLTSAAAPAQLSPGALSRAHAELEGSSRCLECHHVKRGVDRSRCLECHDPLAERVAAGLGLHVQKGYEACESCHIEHHGLDFELVWWGEEGVASFDHDLTGYPLEGAHQTAGREAGCRSCHRPEFVQNPGPLLRAGKDLARTYLGLDSECLSCHQDEHRGAVAADSCLTCHDLEAWTPVSGFDHAETRFPLTGRHGEVACRECHATVSPSAPGASAAIEFRVDRFMSCSDCHDDAHEGRLGSTCESCHTTDGWLGFDRAAFDHDRTRFSLRGAHRTAGCESCHRSGGGFKARRFASCSDCHADSHVGQLDHLMVGEGCPACHTVERFVPADFTLEKHQESDYPLEGSHLAVPCLSCHGEVALEELGFHWEVPSGAAFDRARQFRFRETACIDCHADPHLGEVESWLGEVGCVSCHALSGWLDVTFDHARTGFLLEGGHGDVGCVDCHPSRGEIGEPIGKRMGESVAVQMTGASPRCSSCHDDPHAGQFEARGVDACSSCHDVESWQSVAFDHDRDSQFPLVGGHVGVPCGSCHPTESREGREVVRFKPLSTACESCHR